LGFFSDFPNFYAYADQEIEMEAKHNPVIKNDKISLSGDSQNKRDVFFEMASYQKEDDRCNRIENEMENKLYKLVWNYPIGEMVPYIAEQDHEVAAFLIGIAKKESDWGKHSPSKYGQDCYNYWGYKGNGSNGSATGYACFGSAEEAVEVVGGKIDSLVSRGLNNPSRMVIWKCGSSCAGHDPGSVKKWISDVSGYYNQIAYTK